MKMSELILKLQELRKRDMDVFRVNDFKKMFPEESDKSIEVSLRRMVDAKILARVTRGLYVSAERLTNRPMWLIEKVAVHLRPEHMSYLSLESALSEFGLISQIPMGCMTVMTHGPSGRVSTILGTVEFTHTDRPLREIVEGAKLSPPCPIRYANVKMAVEDLVRVGRNVNMIDIDALEEVKELWMTNKNDKAAYARLVRRLS